MFFHDKHHPFDELLFSNEPLLLTALATPYRHGKVHFDSLVRLVELQNKYADGIVTLGTTGEPSLLSQAEREQVVATVKLHSALPTIVGLCANATDQAVLQARRAESLGANALLVPPPSFCKCTPNGYVKHILRIADACDIPLILYNVPSRAAYEITPSIVHMLAERGVNLVKDASENGNLVGIDGVFALSGSDENLVAHLRKGAKGVISVCGNAFPALTKQYMLRHMSSTTTNGETKQCTTDIAQTDNANGENIDNAFETLAKLCMQEISPIAVKYLLYKTGIFTSCDVRLPLTAANKQTRNAIDKFLEEFADVLAATQPQTKERKQ